MRIKHYVKNLLIFVPLFFSRNMFNYELLISAILGFVSFCCISSAVYIINDIRDIQKDRNHPRKKNRPIASGRISKGTAYICFGICLFAATAVSFLYLKPLYYSYLLLYFVLNIAYSYGLKNYPIIDVVILASGFVLRILYGGGVTGVEVSTWLYLVVVTGSLYMGLGKRRNELKQQNNSREVLKYYNESFLDKNMYVAVAVVIVFYALWTIESSNEVLAWTVPVFIIILMRYSFDVEGDSDGDPIEVLLHDRVLIILSVIYAISIFVILYLV